MNLYFCDLCNESIPQADLDLGRAVRRNERLICPACEGAMSGDHARPGAVAPTSLPAPVVGSSRDSGSSVAAVALAFGAVALVVGVGFGAYLFWLVEQRASGLRQEIADLERAAPEHARTVSAALTEESRAREDEVAAARASIQAMQGRIQELEQVATQHSALERRLDRLDGRMAALDDLAGRVQRQTGAVDQLSQTVTALSAARPSTESPASRAPSAGDPPPKLEVPAAEPKEESSWKRWLADLASPESGARWQAVQGIGASGDGAAVVHLVPMLADSDIFVRMAACRHLGDLGSVEAIPALIDTLEDEEAAVREAALVALRALSGQSIPYDPLARDGDRSKRVKGWREWWEKASKDLIEREKQKSKS